MRVIKLYYSSNREELLPISALDVHPELVQKLEEMGIIETRGSLIDYKHLQRIYKYQRLRNLLGVNLSGAAIIFDLLERIEALEREIEELKK